MDGKPRYDKSLFWFSRAYRLTGATTDAECRVEYRRGKYGLRYAFHGEGPRGAMLSAGTAAGALLHDDAQRQVQLRFGYSDHGLAFNRERQYRSGRAGFTTGNALELAEAPGIIHVRFQDRGGFPQGNALPEYARRAGSGAEAAGQAQVAETFCRNGSRRAGPCSGCAVQHDRDWYRRGGSI